MERRTAMSAREVRRAAVLARVVAGEYRVTEAATRLGMSYRQTSRLVARYRARGPAGLVHGNVGRRSNRARPEAERAQVLALVEAHYGGGAARGPGQRFGPTLAAEALQAEHEVTADAETLRRWMLGAGLWSRARRGVTHRQRRERRAHFGELVQIDGSFHDWLEGRGPRGCLMTLVDDATGTMLARLGAEETTWAAAGVLEAWIAAYGVPRALYTDRKTVYVREPTTAELLTDTPPVTQFGRMCAALGIGIVAAESPQAHGRVERNHGTQQDRLIKQLRRAGIDTHAGVNAYLVGTYLPAHNARFRVAPRAAADFHLPLPTDYARERVFCLETERQMGADGVIQYATRLLQVVPHAAGRAVPVKGRVVVRETEAGTLRVYYRERVVPYVELTARPMGASLAAAPSPPGPRVYGRPPKPAADHIFRRQDHARALADMRRKAAAVQREDDDWG